MKLFITYMVIFGALVTLTSQVVAGPTINSNKLNPNPSIPQVKTPIPATCSDLGISLNVTNHNKNADGSYNFTLMTMVKNHGPSAYHPGPTIHSMVYLTGNPGASLRTDTFGDIMPAHFVNFNYRVNNYRKGNEFFTGYKAQLGFTMSTKSTSVGDCSYNNNVATITGAQIDSQLLP